MASAGLRVLHGILVQVAPASEELDDLRRRVYGPVPAQPVTESEIARLRELEDRQANPPAVPSTREASISPEGSSNVEPTVAVKSRSGRFGHLSWRGWLLAACAAVGISAISYAIGVVIATPSLPDELPELATSQSEEDVIPPGYDLVGAPSLEPASTRFIARIEGFDVFLGQQVNSPYLCLVTFRLDQPPVTSTVVTCGGSVATGGMLANLDETLDIVVGEVAGITGSPIPLSESVTAYQR